MDSARLTTLFDQLNQRHFEGRLLRVELRFEARLRVTAGRFFCGSYSGEKWIAPVIEVAAWASEKSDAELGAILAHEMIHYWLWSSDRPFGHTREFSQKLVEMGAPRYASGRRRAPMRYLYRCPGCGGAVKARRRLVEGSACRKCCREFALGSYDAQFKLQLLKKTA